MAVMAVTVALCADQLASAAPLPKAPVVEMAARLVIRLSESFPKSVARDIRTEIRSERINPITDVAHATVANVFVAHRDVSPFQFRLPPPSL